MSIIECSEQTFLNLGVTKLPCLLYVNNQYSLDVLLHMSFSYSL